MISHVKNNNSNHQTFENFKVKTRFYISFQKLIISFYISSRKTSNNARLIVQVYFRKGNTQSCQWTINHDYTNNLQSYISSVEYNKKEN